MESSGTAQSFRDPCVQNPHQAIRGFCPTPLDLSSASVRVYRCVSYVPVRQSSFWSVSCPAIHLSVPQTIIVHVQM
jgi:hypothetical protein